MDSEYIGFLFIYLAIAIVAFCGGYYTHYVKRTDLHEIYKQVKYNMNHKTNGKFSLKIFVFAILVSVILECFTLFLLFSLYHYLK